MKTRAAWIGVATVVAAAAGVRADTKRVSLAEDGSEPNRESRSAAVSDDGNVIAFVSEAWNLVEGDTNDVADVFLRDLATDTLERVSVASGGAQANNESIDVRLSEDGRFAAFDSVADNLVA